MATVHFVTLIQKEGVEKDDSQNLIDPVEDGSQRPGLARPFMAVNPNPKIWVSFCGRGAGSIIFIIIFQTK
jgi:hypothetical protein